MSATGTDGKGTDFSCPKVARKPATGCDSVIPVETSEQEGSSNDTSRNPLKVRGIAAGCERLIADDTEAPPRFEPGYDGFAIRCLSTWLRGRVCISVIGTSHPVHSAFFFQPFAKYHHVVAVAVVVAQGRRLLVAVLAIETPSQIVARQR